MTHTLHRRGTAESLSKDFVVMTLRAMGFNNEGYLPKCQEFLRIALRHNPVNMASEMKGNRFEFPADDIIAEANGDSFAVFDNPADLTEFLKEVKEADLGLSVIVSGIFEKVDECFEKAGLKHHTANFSLGIWGKQDLLPDNDILEVTTMCGHGMIPANLVKVLVNEIREGRRTPEAAAKVLAPNCSCGVFNPVRAAELLEAVASK
ncbi:MAG: hypothetical protein ABIK32_01800 [Chloroflexota bacterium]|nr:hypothetical protein [Chloroflexota bacterium]